MTHFPSLWKSAAHLFTGLQSQMRHSTTMQPWTHLGHMQGLHAEESCRWRECPSGQYLDLGFRGLRGWTDQALRAGQMRTVWRQRKVPALILLRLSKVKHHSAASVGQVALAFGLVGVTNSDLIGPGKVMRHRLGGLVKSIINNHFILKGKSNIYSFKGHCATTMEKDKWTECSANKIFFLF